MAAGPCGPGSASRWCAASPLRSPCLPPPVRRGPSNDAAYPLVRSATNRWFSVRPLRGRDAHRGGELAAEVVRVAGDLDGQRPAERLALGERERDAGDDPALGEVAEHGRVGVGDADEGD